MSYKRLLTIQDISCVGQCSITVALPIISACGIETCVLPSAVLSTHTGGFKGYTFRDLAEDIPQICRHWQSEGISFDAVYTGYLGSEEQIAHVCEVIDRTAKAEAKIIVDPAMADNGVLYSGFDLAFAEAMKRLCIRADHILPNITEACLLTGTEYKTEYGREYIDGILSKLVKMGCKSIILTGVSYRSDKTGVVVFSNGKYSYYEHKKLSAGSHGTGDVYASAFTAALVKGKDVYEAAKIAADYTLECIEETAKHENHWYGAAFEPVLYRLIEMVK